MTRKRITGLLVCTALFLGAFASVANAVAPATHEVPTLMIVNPLDNDTIVFRNSGLNSTVGVKVVGCTAFDDGGMWDHIHAAWQDSTGLPNRWTTFAQSDVKIIPVADSSLPTTDTFNCDETHSYYAAWVELTGPFAPGQLLDIAVYVCGDGAPNFNDHVHGNLPTGQSPSTDCDNDGDSAQYEGWDEVTNVLVGNPLDFVGIDLTFPKHGDSVSNAGFTATWVTSLNAEDSAVAYCPGITVDPNGAGVTIGDVPDFATGTSVPGGTCVFKNGVVVATGAANLTWEATFTDAEIGNGAAVTWVFADPTPGGAGAFDFNAADATFDRSYSPGRRALDIPEMIRAVWANPAAPGTHLCESGATTMTTQIDPYGLPIFPNNFNTTQDDPYVLICVTNAASGGLNGIKVVSEIESQPAAGGSCVDADTEDFGRWGNVDDPATQNPLPATGTNPCSRYHPQKIDFTGEFDERDGPGTARAYVNAIKVGTTVIRHCIDSNGNNTGDAGELCTRTTLITTGAGSDHNHVWKSGTEDSACHNGLSNVALPAGQTVTLVGCVHDAGHNSVPNSRVIWRTTNLVPGLGSPGFFTGTPDQTTNAQGKAFATFSSNPADAGRTARIHFCGDRNADGICDTEEAVLEVHIGGGSTGTVGTTVTLSVTPTIGVIGTPFTLTGTVADVNTPSQTVGGGAVTIQRRYVGDLDWVTIGTATTIGSGLTGQGTYRFVDNHPTAGALYRAVFGGGGGFATSTSNDVRIWVRVGVHINVVDPTLLAGQSAVIVGRILPSHPDKFAVLQVLTSAGWRSIARQTIGTDEFVRFHVTRNNAGSLLYRITFPTQDADHAWNVSRNRRITWS